MKMKSVTTQDLKQLTNHINRSHFTWSKEKLQEAHQELLNTAAKRMTSKMVMLRNIALGNLVKAIAA
jgi:hypothetical protein